jgi:hypothetical protein
MFQAATRRSGDFSGVFEFDGETSCFYLYQHNPTRSVAGAIHICSGVPDFRENDWAMFDAPSGIGHGGTYRSAAIRPSLDFE